MYTALVVLLVLDAAALIGLILLQQGKGADAGAAFGSGASGTVFGSRGSANFLTHTTAWLAAGFFVLTLALGYLVHAGGGGSIMERMQQKQQGAAQKTPTLNVGPASGSTAAAKVVAPPVTTPTPAPASPAVPAAGGKPAPAPGKSR